MNPETLAIYAQDLSSYSLTDVAAVLDGLGRQERRDGESAFPAIGTILEALRSHRKANYDREALDKINAQQQHYRDHPEIYCTSEEVAELAQALNEKFGLERPKEIDTTPVLMACPHCSKELPVAPNIRFWTSQELRYHADTLDEVQRQSAANRTATLEAQKEPLTETV